MIKLISIFIWGILFFLAFRAIKYIIQLVGGGEKKEGTFKTQKDSKINIKKEDIIEADFEEIKEKDSDKSK